MARVVGDLWPQASGSASLGVEQTGLDGFGREIRPFGHIHMNSGIFHDPSVGGSGVIRLQKSNEPIGYVNAKQNGFGFSVNGGIYYPLEIMSNNNLDIGADLVTPNGAMRIITSGSLTGISTGHGANSVFTTVDGYVALVANGGGNGRGDIVSSATQQIELDPFNGSGSLNYRFGPHQSWYIKTTHTNGTGGPFNDGFWPIAHSGNVAQMIAQAGGGAQSLQAAYNGGSEIIIGQHGNYFDGVVVREPTTPNQFDGHHTALIEPASVSAGISVSGGALPNPLIGIAGTYRLSSLSSLSSQYLHIRSSGSASLNSSAVLFGFDQKDFGPSIGVLLSSGTFHVRTHTGDIQLYANATVKLQPFNGSGELEYRMGPYQAWHWKPTYGGTGGPAGDGFQPIPHSGQIANMISAAAAAGGSLQAAYVLGRTINTTALDGGPVAISGITTYGLRLAQLEGGHPHMLLSGIYAQATAASVSLPGALWLQAHSAGIGSQLGVGTVTNQADASAMSLGIPTLFYNTNGSGITSVRVASGIMQAFNNSASAAIDNTGIMLPLSVITTPSNFYAIETTSGVQILVPGFYKITYVAVFEKTLGSLTQQVATEVRNQDKWGRVFRMLGSNSTAILRDNNVLNLGVANGQWLGDLKSNDYIVVFANTTEVPPADNSLRAKSRQCNLIIEWIGPRCGGESTLQKVS